MTGNKNRYLVTGASGQLGSAVMRELERRGMEAAGVSRTFPSEGSCPGWFHHLDITDREEVLRLVDMVRPEIIIHCAAWTDVDAAQDPANRSKVCAANVQGTENLAYACKISNSVLVYVSTDYVFDGKGNRPWLPDETECAPINLYGLTKYLGERAVTEQLSRFFIVRTAWLFGKNRDHFVRKILRAAEEKKELRVVNDQIGRPTYTEDLAGLLIDMSQTDQYGIYHATNEGEYVSWYEFACEICRQRGLCTDIIPIFSSEADPGRAPRPLNSRLNTDKLEEAGFGRLPDWKESLGKYLLGPL